MARKSPETGAAASRPNITLHNVIFKNVQVPIVAPPGSKVEIRGSRFIPPRRPTGSEQKSSKKSGGWTPALDQAKQSLPVQCPECKTIFPSQVKFLPAIELDVSGNTEPCPICNYPEARLADGIFRVGQDTIEVLSADETNRTMLEAFLRITSDVVAGKLSEQEAIKEADSISPRFGKIVENAFKFGLPTVAIIVSIANYILTHQGQIRSGKAAGDLLQAVTEQTYILTEIKNQKVQGQSANPSEAKPDQKSSTIKSPPRRRKNVSHRNVKRSKPRT